MRGQDVLGIYKDPNVGLASCWKLFHLTEAENRERTGGGREMGLGGPQGASARGAL